MPPNGIPVGLTTAALLKTQLDRGKDYFDLLLPFVDRALARIDGELIEPQQVRSEITQSSSLQLPLRTVLVLLDRLVRAKQLRKESGRYLRIAKTTSELTIARDELETTEQFEQLGRTYMSYATAKGLKIPSAAEAVDQLADYLEMNGAALLLDQRHSTKVLSRREEIVAASFISEQLSRSGDEANAINSLLQGLILRRAVLLSDLTALGRRLDGLRVYLDTPFLLSLAGLYGSLANEASREACRVLKSLGAVPAAFDVTVAEIRRILGVYEDRLDTADGRASLDYTPLTQYFFATKATGSEVRMRSALLEVQLGKEGIPVHPTPTRQSEYVDDEMGLWKALADKRGPRYAAREDHDVDCVAAILTIRQGASPSRLDEARAIFAASGRVVISVMKWWGATEHVGIAPIIDHSALMNYCWLKKPAASSTMLRRELAALCAATLKPSQEAWSAFVKQLDRMARDGLIESDEAAALLIDDLAAKFVVEVEDDTALTPSSMTEVIDRLRAQQRAEVQAQAEAFHAAATAEREQWEAKLEELARDHQDTLRTQAAEYDSKLALLSTDLSAERAKAQALANRADRLTESVDGLAEIIASLISYALTAVVVLAVVVIAVFPLFDADGLSPLVRHIAQTLTVIAAVLGGVFGFAAVPWGKSVRDRIKRTLLKRATERPRAPA